MTRKITVIAIIAAIAVAAIGIGYALSYTATTTNTDNTASGELITIALDDGAAISPQAKYSNFLTGIYTVDTNTNSSGYISFANPQMWESISDIDPTALTGVQKYNYDSNTGAVTQNNSGAYDGYKIGTVKATIQQSTSAKATNVTLNVTKESGKLDAVFHTNGLSLVYGCKVNGGTETYYATTSGTNLLSNVAVTLTNGVGTVELNAYLMYPNTAQSTVSYTTFDYSTASTLTFVATAAPAS